MIWVLVGFSVFYIGMLYVIYNKHPELFTKDNDDDDMPFFPGY